MASCSTTGAASANGASAARMRTLPSTAAHSQTLTTNSGCSFDALSVMRSSTYLAPTPFSTLQRGAALVVALVRALAGEECRDLVLAGLQVAEPQALHAAALQGFLLALGVEVVRDLLVVHLELHGIDREERADVHRHEHGHLRARGEQQVLLQHEEVAVEVDDLAAQRLDLGVEHRAVAGGRRRGGFVAECGHRRGERPPGKVMNAVFMFAPAYSSIRSRRLTSNPPSSRSSSALCRARIAPLRSISTISGRSSARYVRLTSLPASISTG